MIDTAYIRVSTKDQNPDLQREKISSWAQANGVEEVPWYEDRISGDKSFRPQLDALKKDIFAGKVKTVILWKLDRLARLKRDGETLLADWCGRNVRVVSITQQIDLSGVVGQIVAWVLLGLGEIELSNVRERQAAGIAVAKKRGVCRGRKFGTTKGEPTRARELRSQGLIISSKKEPSIASIQFAVLKCYQAKPASNWTSERNFVNPIVHGWMIFNYIPTVEPGVM